ncbi:hypothetical protein ACSNOI_22130 [Actinomadura kijaniata]|uniref:hypothetical protein n=1 Tax=Actinomadura kijaniata TaxID=46161 RepID=UPI003F1B5CE4
MLDGVRPGPEFPAGWMLHDALERVWPRMPRRLADRYHGDGHTGARGAQGRCP